MGSSLTCPVCKATFRDATQPCPRHHVALVISDVDPWIGKRIGSYQVEERLGAGGQAVVYGARHVILHQRVAIKMPFGESLGDKKLLARLVTEAMVSARYRHRNVVATLDCGTTPEGVPYLVMEMVAGKTLLDLVDAKPMDEVRALDLIVQILDGLQHIHDRGCIHRDLKLENVFVTYDDEALIGDHGLGLSLGAPRLTDADTVAGTPLYMSPEQLRNAALDHRVDLFAAGVVLYEMIAGCAPFDGGPLQLMTKNLFDEPPPIAARAGVAVEPDVEALIMHLLRKDRDQRPVSAAAAAVAARKILADRKNGARPQHAALADTAVAAPRPASRRRRVWPAIVAVAIVAVAAGLAAGRTGDPAPRRRPTPAVVENPSSHPEVVVTASAHVDGVRIACRGRAPVPCPIRRNVRVSKQTFDCPAVAGVACCITTEGGLCRVKMDQVSCVAAGTCGL